MNSFFTKVGVNARKIFNKSANDPNIYRKIQNTARKVDNSAARVGHFLTSTANSLGFNKIGGYIKDGTDAIHDIRNNLEKSISTPLNQIRDKVNYA